MTNITYKQLTDQQYKALTTEKSVLPCQQEKKAGLCVNLGMNSKVIQLQARLEGNCIQQKTVTTKQFFANSSYTKRLNEQFLLNLQNWVKTLDAS